MPECGEGAEADAGLDSRTRLARPNSQARMGGRGNIHFPCSADPVDHTLLYVMTIHTYIITAVFIGITPVYNFIPIVGVGKRGAYYLVYGDLPRQHPFGTTVP